MQNPNCLKNILLKPSPIVKRILTREKQISTAAPQRQVTAAGRVAAAVEITRPHNCLIGGLSILVAAFLARPIHAPMAVLFAVISGMLITGGANVLNDWYDIDIDRINRPGRVLPSGRLSPGFGLAFSIILFVCGLIFSIFVNKIAVIIAVTTVFALIGYSARLKRTVLGGNLVVSMTSAAAFVYGAVAAGEWKDGMVPATFAFLFHLGREILKDIEDVAGDAAMAAITLPVRFGRKAALQAVTVVYLVLILVTLWPFYAHLYGPAYLAVVVIGVDLVLAGVLVALWRMENPPLRRINALLKVDMLIGLLAIYFGK